MFKGKKNISYGCVMVLVFVVVFILAFLALAVWNQYKNIPNDITEQISNTKDRRTVNEKFRGETDDDPSWGNPKAGIVIVEFSDFECPYCKKMFTILHELNNEYPQKIKFIYRDFVVHNASQKLAEAAECADEQGKFLAYHDKLFINQGDNSADNLKAYARQIEIPDLAGFDNCLDSGRFENEVKQDYREGQKLGVKGTPTFFVNGVRIRGALPKDIFTQVIEQLLSAE